MTEEKNNKIVVYTAISDSRFGETKSLRVWERGENIADCKNSIEISLNNWKKHLKGYQEKNDLEGIKFAENYIKQYTEELKTIKVIDILDYKKEQEKNMLTGPQEITENDYWEMLEILPPLKMGKNFFIMSEFQMDSFTRQFFKKAGKYYTQMIDYKNQDTWAVL